MADTRGMADLFGQQINRMAKGFGNFKYTFINECQTNKMKGDSIRWFAKTAGVMTATAPSVTANVSPGARPTQLEQSWTRNTSYKQTFFVEGTLDDEDINDSEIDILAPTIQDLTENIVSVRDAHIWDVMSEGQSPSEIQTFATTAAGGDQWDAANYAADPIADLNRAKRLLKTEGYESNGATLLLDVVGYESLVNWLISGKGSSIPGFSSEKIKTGIVLQILNLNVKESLNVTTDKALVIVPKRAVTYSESKGITATITKDEQISRTIRIKTSGVAYRTDPKAIVLITDINTA